MKSIVKIILGILAVACIVIAFNYINLQRHMSSVLKEDPRNKGVRVWVHYKWFVNPTELKYDFRSMTGENSSLDVNRVMLQFAEKIKDKQFNKVYLGYKGEDKFYFKGDFFQNLGKEYGLQNPVYTLRTMPENVYLLNGEHAYGVWDGGWLGVMNKQMEDLNTFAKDWYLDGVIKDMSN
ncbi:hypothetical protein B9T31_17585 [Acinetobacter sp. ANC 4558]|uniref:hypothetical protein n=1 Tax=Acinetobacter sp. ANC 4558 TaxID=1977876 RepID=UPI000A34B9D0|nr:hypothetical protein [Acinetobacter sp. ANC 4558]OTG78499.1 hypothetical protein B9T31_17585 [Acinetobacter sp. ANC 4558]